MAAEHTEIDNATRAVTEADFYAAVKAACDKAGIDSTGRGYVEMSCLDNATDPSQVWEMAIDTLDWFVSSGDLLAISRNESPSA